MSMSIDDQKKDGNKNQKEVWNGIRTEWINSELERAETDVVKFILQKKEAENNIENADYEIKHYTNMKKLSKGGIVKIIKDTLDFLHECHVPCVRIWDPSHPNEMYIYDLKNEKCTLYDNEGIHPQPFVWNFRNMNMQLFQQSK